MSQNRAERARQLLLNNVGRRVTIRMMEEAGIAGYTARNAISEARAGLEKAGYRVVHEYHGPGEGVWDNGWRLVPLQAEQLDLLRAG